MNNLDLTLSDISKIEGKATLTVKVENGKIKKLQFQIAEYKRFYTQAIRGKDIVAIPQLTARICGTCSNAHLLCAIKAAEDVLGVKVSKQTELLRKLVNYGLYIRDHALHLYIFVLPDILGVDSIFDLDEEDSKQYQILEDAFLVKEAGNILGKTIGGRSVHAPYPVVGGFTKLPEKNDLPDIIDKLEKARPAVLRLIEIFRKCDFEQNTKANFAALLDSELSFLGGTIYLSQKEDYQGKGISGYLDKVSDFTKADDTGKIVTALQIPKQSFGDYLEHVVIPYSHASGYKYMDKLHMVGALARLNLGKDRLYPKTRKDAKDALSLFPSDNIYHNNLAQAIEILHAVDSALDILEGITIYQEKPEMAEKKRGVGIGVIEAPRGTLFYRLEVDDRGKVQQGQIVVPTGQNQIGIEDSLYCYLKQNIEKNKEVLTHAFEKIIRAYDPCMSCASHFLKVKWLSG